MHEKSTVFAIYDVRAHCCLKQRTALQEKSMRTMPSMFIPAFALPNALVWTLRNTKFRATDDIVDGYLVVSTPDHVVPSRFADVNRADCILFVNVQVASVVAGLCAFGQLVLHVIFWTPPPPPGDLEKNLLPPDGDNGGESTDTARGEP
jgi:hypothetical protein